MRLIYLSDSQHNEEQQQKQIYNVNQHLNNEKPIVIYFYREKCPYCIQTSKEWANIKQHIEKEDDDLLAVKANGELYDSLENVGDQPRIFPTIRYVYKSKVTPFTKEGSQRTASSLAKWIEEMTQQKIEPNKSIGREKSFSYGLPIESSSSISTDVPEYEFEPTIVRSNYTSNKYPPYSNRFIAHNFNSTLKNPLQELEQINIPLKSSQRRRTSQYRSKSKSKSIRRSLPISNRRSSQYRSKSKSIRRSLPISNRRSSQLRSKSKSKRSYNTRFRSVRSKPTQGTTAMF